MRTLLEILKTPRTFKVGENVVVINYEEQCGYILGILEDNSKHSDNFPYLLRNYDTFRYNGHRSVSHNVRSLLTVDEANELGFNIVIPIPDKSLVWCWDKGVLGCSLKFYDSINETTFGPTGNRDGVNYRNYKAVTEEEIESSPMIQELLKMKNKLEE